ncbi:MAG TPA: efflux RND transporter periplasmic adaptor subunit [Gemmataceae bacterium]|nr:efflux RND transporter periplasmic adaptor subunit [Gemmataceae bacterium]
MTGNQAEAEQSNLQSKQLALAKVVEEKRVLVDAKYGVKVRNETDYETKVATAKDKLLVAQSSALATEVQKRSDRDSKRSVWEQERDKYKDIKDEIQKCKIYAPQDGMVVYYIAEQARWGAGSQQSIVAQGEPVRENQKLMQIPELKKMIVNTKVHEALVSRVHKRQPASIKIDSFADSVFKGHVDSVAAIASQQDFFAADVKVYATKVAIDANQVGLRPGMSAEVTITIGDALDHVLTVPIEAIVGGIEMRKHRTCFVMTPDGPVERDVTIGMSNETMAQVKDGLQDGDVVVLNPRALVGDSAKTRQPGSGPSSSGDDAAKGTPPAAGPGAKGPGGEGQGGPAGEANPAAPQGGAPGMRRPGGGAPGTGRPGGGAPGAGGPGGGQGGFQMTPEQRKQMQQQTIERFKKLSPAERKQQLEQLPEAYRGRVKDLLNANGITIPD